MRRILTSLAALLLVAAGSWAEAYQLSDWTFDTTQIGGLVTINHINGIGMSGGNSLVQNATNGVVNVGDTFTLTDSGTPSTPVVFTAGSYINSSHSNKTPFLGAGDGVLSLQSSTALTGTVYELLSVGYKFRFNDPGAGVLNLIYTDPSSVAHTIATFDLIPSKSTGISTDGNVSTSDLLQGTSTLSGVMHVVLAGVLFDSGGHDLNGSFYQVEFGALGSGFNYEVTGVSPTSFSASGSANGNFTLAVVPEPASLLLLGSGVLSAAFLKRKNRKGQVAA